MQNILSSQLESADDQKKHEVWRLMQLVALHNQLNQRLGPIGHRLSADFRGFSWVFHVFSWIFMAFRVLRKRIFMQKDVEMALQHDSELLPLWNGFVEASDVPFVKILADGEDAEYQFRTSSAILR